MQRSVFPLITAGWFLTTLIMAGLSLYADYTELRKALNDDAHFVYTSIFEKTYINEVLLQNFTVQVSARPQDKDTIRSFANEMRKRYPHIKRFEILQQKPALTSTYSGNGFNIIPEENRYNASFPVIFVEPLTADTRYLMNKDLFSDPLFSETISFARRYHQPVVSAPFKLDNNMTAYSLMLAFFDRNTQPDAHNLYIAILVIDISSLLPSSSFLSDDAQISLKNNKGELLDQLYTTDQHHELPTWLPTLKEQRTINRFGQAFELEVETQFSSRNIDLGQLLMLLIGSTVGYLLLMAYLRQRILVASQQSSLYEKLDSERQQLEQRIHARTQELRDQLIENQRLTHQVLAMQESERRNLSRELHDELGQSLTAIRTDAKILKRIHPEEGSIVNQTAESIDAIAQHIYDVTYGMMRTLRPSALDDLGLVDAIRECIAGSRFSENGITLHTDFQGALNEMPEEYNITLFRLAQEAFSNIIKYSQAKNAWIDIHRIEEGRNKEIAGDRLEITISDDGVGFDIDRTAYKSGFGLIGMRERVRALGGSFTIKPNHEQGTRIVAVIPVITSAIMSEPEATADPEAPVGPLH